MRRAKTPKNTQDSQDTRAPIEQLPDEMLLHIFSFLGASRARAGKVSTTFRRFATDVTFKDENEIIKCNAKQAIQSKQIACDILLSPQPSSSINIAIIGDDEMIKFKILNLTNSANSNTSYYPGLKLRSFPDVGGNKLQLFNLVLSKRDPMDKHLTTTNIILLCPNPLKPISPQLAVLEKKLLDHHGENYIVFVLNGDINDHRYISIKHEQDDSIQTFYARMYSLAHERNNQLTEQYRHFEQDNDPQQKKRCIIS